MGAGSGALATQCDRLPLVLTTDSRCCINRGWFSRWHLESVVSTNGKRSHWVAKAPLPAPIEWDADIVTERENALLSWRSLPGSEVDHAGTVRFRELPNGRGTEVRVRLEYAPPGGMVGVAVANLFKALTEQQLKEDLRRFKQIIETGETPTTADYTKVSQGVSC